jgi:hypothetical protein
MHGRTLATKGEEMPTGLGSLDRAFLAIALPHVLADGAAAAARVYARTGRGSNVQNFSSTDASECAEKTRLRRAARCGFAITMMASPTIDDDNRAKPRLSVS